MLENWGELNENEGELNENWGELNENEGELNENEGEPENEGELGLFSSTLTRKKRCSKLPLSFF